MLKKPGIPIIFYHVGDRQFADVALDQAAVACPNSDVILLTDRPRAGSKIREVPIHDYAASAAVFSKSYVHISSNSFAFELNCYLRWFVIREFVARHGLERICVFDTDIMLFAPVEQFASEFGGYGGGSWAWGNCFNGLPALDSMCDYFFAVHQNATLRTRLAAKFAPTPLSDMNLMFELAEQDNRVLDQQKLPIKGYDDNIRCGADLFLMNGPIKHLTFGTTGVPHATTLTGERVAFRFLHFQGPAKVLMRAVSWSAQGLGAANSHIKREEWLLNAPNLRPAS